MVLTEGQTHYSLYHSYLYLSILGITCLTDCEDDTAGLYCVLCVYNKQLINCVKTFPIRLGSAISGATFLSFLSSQNLLHQQGQQRTRCAPATTIAVQCIPLIPSTCWPTDITGSRWRNWRV